MIVALAALIVTRSAPDIIAVLGGSWQHDREIVARDCDSQVAFWKKRGVPASDIVRANLCSRKDARTVLRGLHKRMDSSNSGRLAIFLSGHGTVLREGNVFAPALSFQVQPSGEITSQAPLYEEYAWKSFFKDLDVPEGWKVFLLPDV